MQMRWQSWWLGRAKMGQGVSHSMPIHAPIPESKKAPKSRRYGAWAPFPISSTAQVGCCLRFEPVGTVYEPNALAEALVYLLFKSVFFFERYAGVSDCDRSLSCGSAILNIVGVSLSCRYNWVYQVSAFS